MRKFTDEEKEEGDPFIIYGAIVVVVVGAILFFTGILLKSNLPIMEVGATFLGSAILIKMSK